MTTCANGCMQPITAGESASVVRREIGSNGVVIYERRHLDCTRIVWNNRPATVAVITAE
jgi:hypothetical protein